MVTTGRALTARGLEPDEVRQRVAAGKVNIAPDGPSRSTADIVRANVVTRFNILLGVLLVVTLVVLREPRDALFGIVLVANALIGIVQELRAKRTLDRLELLTAPRARALRGGQLVDLPIDEIVVDDIIELRSGDQLAVDGLVVAARGLEINEALLTGESDPVAKDIGDRCLSGSFVSAGSGRFRVTEVGADAYAVKLALEAKKFTLVRSELRDGIDWMLGAIGWAVAPAIALVVWTQMRGRRRLPRGATQRRRPGGGDDPAGSGVAHLDGVRHRGDQAGTSPGAGEGAARHRRPGPGGHGLLRQDRDAHRGHPGAQRDRPARRRRPRRSAGGAGRRRPGPERHIGGGGRRLPRPPEWAPVASIAFSSARKWSGSSFAGQGTWVLGAPDVIAPADADVGAIAREASEAGQRVLLLSHGEQPLDSTLPDDLAPVALLIFGDRIRSDAAETLRFFADQGVAAKVISGDHPETVAAVARSVGVVGSAEYFDARHLPDDPDELADLMETHTVFGRVTPHQKRAMVAAMQSPRSCSGDDRRRCQRRAGVEGQRHRHRRRRRGARRRGRWPSWC